MKIKMLLLAMLFTASASLAKWEPPKLYRAAVKYANGQVVNGFAQLPYGGDATSVVFQGSENGVTKEINSNDLSSITYIDSTPNDTVIFERIKIKSFMGVSNPKWAAVVVKGYATLYYYDTMFSHSVSLRVWLAEDSFCNYACRRPNEPVATNIRAGNDTGRGLDPNKPFVEWAVPYFTDDPVILKKIKDRMYTYKDVVAMVNEYNARVK